ncbi:hypothetical protein AAGS40_09520 [Paraburkholderia sp. PREW-6R]|uniref:hypothetical protein n=1 Tax=Paraburkholderia sp. PREW-6R TaxID=3141544 RepID=UPI0031F4B6CC
MSVMPYALGPLHRKRRVGPVVSLTLCALLAACSHDDKAPDTSAVGSAQRSDDNPATNSNTAVVLTANPWAPEPTSSPAALANQSPALPAPGTDTAMSAAASAPLAPPVIHTVD